MNVLAPGSGVVVTGAARGIGKALAARFAAEGCRVVVADIDEDELSKVAHEIGAFAVAGDAASAHGAAALVEAAREHLGTIDAWYGNAGVDRGRGLEASDHAWLTSYEVNVLAHVRAARLLLPEWISSGAGRFVVTSSAAGLLTMLGSPSYAASEHAEISFAEWLAATYRHEGVVAQAIVPRSVKTQMLERSAGLPGFLSADGAVSAEEVADAAWEAAQTSQFWVLLQPDVAEEYAARAADTDAWLDDVNRTRQELDGSSEPA
ncbi:short-subunit dehydrogenase [Nocardioides albertanoniae]|uniref:Short-subunit dehydrogenase n=1 Tax=Nocardioides albertanoniae TaxID=1175486 RepID=A0A543AC97_9ACTN|nr:SDR family oxidoreductase [Nocardioides albertanoniae]TQL70212.1 short-subunit dehydrogenase [Nocardioides albertanoniae]